MDFPKSFPGVGLVDGLFVDEDQVTGQVGSIIPATWGNNVTRELLAVIQAAGLDPSEEQHDQLLKAIRIMGGTYLNKNVAGGADVVLSDLESQSGIINFSGALTANINVIVPNKARNWVFANNTTGVFSLTVKTLAGAGVLIKPAAAVNLYSDGAAVYQVGASETQKQIASIGATVAANALTVSLNPTTLDFRAAALNSGTVNSRGISAPISLVIPSGATLGTASGVAARLALLAIDNAGAVELAVVNLAGSVNLDESTLISTTAISAAAGSAGVIYSASARAAVPFRVVGYFDLTQATAGTWATAPTAAQGRGGLAANLASFGVGYAYQSNGRVSGMTYWNTSGRTIWVLAVSYGQPYQVISGYVNGANIISSNSGGINYSQVGNLCFPVPHGASWRVDISAGGLSSYYDFR